MIDKLPSALLGRVKKQLCDEESAAFAQTSHEAHAAVDAYLSARQKVLKAGWMVRMGRVSQAPLSAGSLGEALVKHVWPKLSAGDERTTLDAFRCFKMAINAVSAAFDKGDALFALPWVSPVAHAAFLMATVEDQAPETMRAAISRLKPRLRYHTVTRPFVSERRDGTLAADFDALGPMMWEDVSVGVDSRGCLCLHLATEMRVELNGKHYPLSQHYLGLAFYRTGPEPDAQWYLRARDSALDWYSDASLGEPLTSGSASLAITAAQIHDLAEKNRWCDVTRSDGEGITYGHIIEFLSDGKYIHPPKQNTLPRSGR